MVTLPGAMAVITPSGVTEAIAGSDEDQVTVRSMALAGLTVATG